MLQIRSEPAGRGTCCHQMLNAVVTVDVLHFPTKQNVGLFLFPCVHLIWYKSCLQRCSFSPSVLSFKVACVWVSFLRPVCVSELQHEVCLIALDAQRVKIPRARPVCMAAQRRHLPHQPPQCHQMHVSPFPFSHTKSSCGPTLHI